MCGSGKKFNCEICGTKDSTIMNIHSFFDGWLVECESCGAKYWTYTAVEETDLSNELLNNINIVRQKNNLLIFNDKKELLNHFDKIMKVTRIDKKQKKEDFIKKMNRDWSGISLPLVGKCGRIFLIKFLCKLFKFNKCNKCKHFNKKKFDNISPEDFLTINPMDKKTNLKNIRSN